ncbi:MAG TPA: sigma-54 dependent transcriptional regulator, partial [Kofleriaceae bacterium]
MSDLKIWRRQFAAEIVGESAEIVDALDTIRRVANTDCSILITGETGSGKELFARATHRSSNRRAKPFIPVNCAALPETLIEAELFGHVKGAFTGAMTARAGRFLSAQGGTLFLDEIGDLPLSAQAKLLRVLEERVVCPVGADSDTPIDVRIVAATHRNLEQMVAEGKFRADLYFRLSVVPLHLPALRDRGDDFDLIVDLTLARMCERTGREPMTLEPTARAAIRSYSWPGNVRELAHRIERAALLARGTQIAEGDLSLPTSRTQLKVVPVLTAEGSGPIPKQEVPVLDDSTLDLRTALEAVERTLIDRALSKANGNRTEAAALLGLNRTTLVEKLRKYA